MHIPSSISTYTLYPLSNRAAGKPATQAGEFVPALPGGSSQQTSAEAIQASAATANPIPSQALTAARQTGVVNPAHAAPFNATLENRRGGLAGALGLDAQRAVAAYEGVAAQELRGEVTQVLGINVFA